MKNSRNKLLATALIVTAALAIFGSASIFQSGATEYIDVTDYCWIEGVLHNDTYALYPYAQESLDIGFSKYGEMIGYDEGTGIGVGLQYPGYTGAGDTYDQNDETSVDPFANELMGVEWWMNGWFIDIKYKTPSGEHREIWAFALFSDGYEYGGDWIELVGGDPDYELDEFDDARPLWQEYPPYANPDSTKYPSPKPPQGGRKTNGHAVTEDIEIVYNGPRRLVAVCKTRIGDGSINLVDICFTYIFNRAEKNVIILKDVKRLYTKKPMNVQFGNRGEWDLGFDLSSYAHFYTAEPVQYWDLPAYDGDIDTTEMGETFEFFSHYMTAKKHPKKWWDEVPEQEIPSTIQSVEIPDEWFESQYTCYGREWHMDKNIKEHSYAVAQVIDENAEYVGALAVWPHPEFWSVENSYPNPGTGPSEIALMLMPISRMLEWRKWTVDEDTPTVEYPEGRLDDRDNMWVKMSDGIDSDGESTEPGIPFLIYEHDFELSTAPTGVVQYRIVSVYALTDYHDADDKDALGDATDLGALTNGVNRIDREIQYQLDEIFDPWDIYDAMHKETKSWVQFFDHDINDEPWDETKEIAYCVQLDANRTVETGDPIPTLPVYRNGDWDAYCASSERVLVNTGTGYTLIYPEGYQNLDPIPLEEEDDDEEDPRPYYEINLDTGLICFWKYDEDLEEYAEWYLPEDSVVKVLWSSEHDATAGEQWTSEDLLYPINNETFRFPLHHDIIDAYKNQTEVFLIEQPPERLPDTDPGGGLPYYEQRGARSLRVHHVPYCKEVDIKYYTYDSGWHEEKFHCDNSDYDDFTTQYDMDYIEKVWIHSEKTLLDGDYVFNNATSTLYMQNPVPDGQWLLVSYTVGETPVENWFLGDGTFEGSTEFVLEKLVGDVLVKQYPDVGSLNVYNTEILQQILPENDTTTAKPAGTKCEVPDPNYDKLPMYRAINWAGDWPNKYGWYDKDNEIQWEEREWINVTDTKVRGNWIIHETCSCDELIVDQAALCNLTSPWPDQELKIVFKVPSGRYEWGIVGMFSRAIDSAGLAMVTAAFKNKLIEIGLGGLDVQDLTWGPRVPWTLRDLGYLGTGRHPDIDYYDSIGRIHLCDDLCSRYEACPSDSWPISSSSIITVGGAPANIMSEYWNSFTNAFMTKGYPGGIDAIFPLTCWNDTYPDTRYVWKQVGSRYGHAAISTYKDKNGTIGIAIWGWTGQDTYYACKWFEENKYWLQHINLHVTDLVLEIEYMDEDGDPLCPPEIEVVEYLGTISEKVEQHDC